jgi:4-hydroxy-tetrahydrodipicolinate reductase
MRIAIIGYGKMGKEIEKILMERNHTISIIIDIQNQEDFQKLKTTKTDVAIEFSGPESAHKNILQCLELNIPVVSGSTGWIDKYEETARLFLDKNGSFFYSSNYSVGVNILFKLNKYLAEIMDRQPEYDVEIEEIHHTTKLDKPSGTAISLAKGIVEKLKRKKSWALDSLPSGESIKISAVRKDNVPGDHTITYESSIDILKICHSAKARRGLAFGAVLAAEFLLGKKGVYGMDDLLNL